MKDFAGFKTSWLWVKQLLQSWSSCHARNLRLATNALFCGMGIHLPVALEGALKLKAWCQSWITVKMTCGLAGNLLHPCWGLSSFRNQAAHESYDSAKSHEESHVVVLICHESWSHGVCIYCIYNPWCSCSCGPTKPKEVLFGLGRSVYFCFDRHGGITLIRNFVPVVCIAMRWSWNTESTD